MATTTRGNTVLRFTVLLDWDEEGQGWAVTVPALPGCFTQGDTREEALANAQEAIAGHLAALAKVGHPWRGSEKVEVATVTVTAPR
ncbi:MAG TPA: type II toxin-antitoxin system HicB family antitoxin [Bacillota bacterium]|nr:type II toxin-antitoxin system HicB family antitoxin [Bacillota bacterium]